MPSRSEAAPQEAFVGVRHEVARTLTQVEDCLRQCASMARHQATGQPSKSYEQGVMAGIQWVLGRSPEHPLGE